jgi:hypothetical protein
MGVKMMVLTITLYLTIKSKRVKAATSTLTLLI